MQMRARKKFEGRPRAVERERGRKRARRKKIEKGLDKTEQRGEKK